MLARTAQVNRHLNFMFSFLTQMQKKLVDHYKPGKVIPYFALEVHLKDGATPTHLRTQIHFDGVEQPAFITIARDPAYRGEQWHII